MKIDLTEHDGLVCAIALKLGAQQPVKDSWQYAEGWIGLIKAIDGFDPARGYVFSTYAGTCIRNEINRVYQAENRVKHGGSGYAKNCEKRPTFQFSQLQRVDSKRALDIAITEVDEEEDDDRRAKLCRAKQLLESPYLLMAYTSSNIQKYRNTAKRNSKIIVDVINGETLTSVGKRYGVSKERVRQIVEKGIERLRRAFDAN